MTVRGALAASKLETVGRGFMNETEGAEEEEGVGWLSWRSRTGLGSWDPPLDALPSETA
jgi:hypothetical protein